MSKSGYYKHIAKSESEKTEAENKVINCFKRHSGNYGRIRIRKALLDEGVDISEYKIAKILKYKFTYFAIETTVFVPQLSSICKRLLMIFFGFRFFIALCYIGSLLCLCINAK